MAKPPRSNASTDTTRRATAAREGRVLVAQSAEPGNQWEAWSDESSVLDIYCDGFGALLFGPSVTKVQIFRTADIEETPTGTKEIRHLIGRVTVPTASLVEFVAKVNTALQNDVRMVEIREKENAKLTKYLPRRTSE